MTQLALRSFALLATCLLLPLPLTAQEEAAAPPKSDEQTAPEPQANPEAEAKPAIALVRPDGVYQDLAEQGGDLTALLLGGGTTKPKSFYEFLGRLDEVTESDTPEVVIDLSGQFAFQMVHLPEVARALGRMKKAGKQLVAYVENADTRSFQIAAMCDRVLMADLGVLDLGAPAMEVMFMRDALDLLGVHFDVVRCGDFKGAVEPYVLPRMSQHLRDHYVAMLEKINAAGVDRIAAGRNLSFEAVREIQGQRLLTAEQAIEAGLVDVIVPWRGARAAIRAARGEQDLAFDDVLDQKKSRRSVNFMQMFSQIFNPRKEEDDSESDSVVVLHLSGTIIDGEKDAPGSIVSKPTVKRIDKLREDEYVKGVVVRINSPGGSATASEAILLALRDLAKAKPVVISMGSLAASGGYYVACIQRPILAEAETITGSIGVFGLKPSAGALMRRVGLHSEIVGLDASAAMTSIAEPWTDEQKARVQAMIDRIYDVFVGHVAQSRGMSTESVLAIAGGRVWSGAQAVEQGLVDRLGGLDDAIAMVTEEAGIEGEPEVRHLPRPRNLFESLLGDMLEAEALIPDPTTRALARRLNLDRALWIVNDALTSERPTTVWAFDADALTVR